MTLLTASWAARTTASVVARSRPQTEQTASRKARASTTWRKSLGKVRVQGAGWEAINFPPVGEHGPGVRVVLVISIDVKPLRHKAADGSTSSSAAATRAHSSAVIDSGG